MIGPIGGDSGRQPGLNAKMDHPILATPPFIISAPPLQTAPVVFASPHSGRSYQPDFLAAARLDAMGLRRSEDCFVDELFSGVVDQGAPLLAATFPRAFCDPNREAWELDPAMFDGPLPDWVNTTSSRVGAGLGTIARIVASGESIYRNKLRFAEAEGRIHGHWMPYHQALAALLRATTAQFGACVLVDCHSMPSQARASAPDFVLGDAHGTSCTPSITRFVELSLLNLGYAVRRNDPYAGGYVTRHYGRPREGTHALQIEISRSLYMDESRFERLEQFDAVRRHLLGVTDALTKAAPELLGQSQFPG